MVAGPPYTSTARAVSPRGAARTVWPTAEGPHRCYHEGPSGAPNARPVGIRHSPEYRVRLSRAGCPRTPPVVGDAASDASARCTGSPAARSSFDADIRRSRHRAMLQSRHVEGVVEAGRDGRWPRRTRPLATSIAMPPASTTGSSTATTMSARWWARREPGHHPRRPRTQARSRSSASRRRRRRNQPDDTSRTASR